MQNTTAPVGRVKGTLDEQSIRLVGRIESPKEFESIVVKRSGDQVVRLGQVAVVQDFQRAQRPTRRTVQRERDLTQTCRALVTRDVPTDQVAALEDGATA